MRELYGNGSRELYFFLDKNRKYRSYLFKFSDVLIVTFYLRKSAKALQKLVMF